jgi:integrase
MIEQEKEEFAIRIKKKYSAGEIEAIRKTIPYFDYYLSQYSRPEIYSPKIIAYAVYCKKHFNKNILDVNIEECELFFQNYISKLRGRKNKYISKKSKEIWRSTIKNYYDIINQKRRKEGKSPVPNPVLGAERRFQKEHSEFVVHIKNRVPDNEIQSIKEDIPYLTNYLNRFSQPDQIEARLVDYAIYCKKHFNKNILDVNIEECELFFQEYVCKLRGQKNKYVTKNTKNIWRSIIKKYYDIVNIYREKMRKDPIPNPVPTKEILKFEGIDHTLDFLLKNKKKHIKYEESKTMLHQLYYNYLGATMKNEFKEYQIFIAMSLQVYSGARIREVLKIKLPNLNLDERWFINTVKSRKDNKRQGIYFFPDFFVPELKQYLSKLRRKYSNISPNYLFYYPSAKDNHLYYSLIQLRLNDIKDRFGIEYKGLTHIFRDFLNTKRLEEGLIEDKFREFLINQSPRRTNIKAYLKKYEGAGPLRDIYDKYNPFHKLLKPSPSLDDK